MSELNEQPSETSWLSRLKSGLKEVIGEQHNLYKELADLLGLSQESIYRRFRGSSSFTFREIRTIAENYPLDFSFLFNVQSFGQVGFSTFYSGPFDINKYLEKVYKSIRAVEDESNARLYCLAADIPIFRLLAYPAIAQFKSVYWRQLSPNPDQIPAFRYSVGTHLPLVKEITRLYKELNVHEIWSVGALRSTLRQVEFYIDNDLVPNMNDAFLLYRDAKDLVKDVFKAEEKWVELYKYELALHNNAFFVDGDKVEELTLVVNSMNSLITRDRAMIDDFKSWLKVVLSRSLRLDEQSRKQKTIWLTELMGQIRKSYRSRLSAEYVEMLE